VVARRVAEILGWDLHNRAIPVAVASRLSLPIEAALAHDEAAESRIGRLLATLSVQLGSDAGGNIPSEVLLGEDSFKTHTESIIRTLAADSNCVIVGRAAAIVLGSSETALHIRLDGSPTRRAHHAAEALCISIEESTRLLMETDRARSLYVKHFYGRDWADSRLYHVVIDSTALSIDACVNVVLAAVRTHFGLATHPTSLRNGTHRHTNQSIPKQ